MGEALVSCDTFVVMPDSTDTGEVTHSSQLQFLQIIISHSQVIFGKNSDRPKGYCELIIKKEKRKDFIIRRGPGDCLLSHPAVPARGEVELQLH